LIAFNLLNKNGRYYPADVVNPEEDKEYFIEFYAPEYFAITLANVCGLATIAKNKDYLYLKKVRFLRDNDNKLIKVPGTKDLNVVAMFKMGAKIMTRGIGSISEEKAIKEDYELGGLFIDADSSYDFKLNKTKHNEIYKSI